MCALGGANVPFIEGTDFHTIHMQNTHIQTSKPENQPGTQGTSPRTSGTPLRNYFQLAPHPWNFHGIFPYFHVFYSRTFFCQKAWQGKNIVVNFGHFGLLLQGQGIFQKSSTRTTSFSTLKGDTKVPMIRNPLWPSRSRMYILAFDFYLIY